MITNWYFLIALALAESFLLALLLTPLMRRAAIRYGVLDHPGERKLQSEPVPLLGGAAIFAAFAATVALNLVLVRISGAFGFAWVEEHVLAFLGDDSARKLVGLALGGMGIFVLGLFDDLNALTPERKLVGQLAACAIPVAFGIRVDLFIEAALQAVSLDAALNPSTLATLKLILSAVASLLWLVTIVNAMNFIDNMDGLCAGITAIASLSFFLCAFPHQEYFVAIALAVLGGAAAGFLYHNLPPAKLFMGDAGAMFCGYVLGALAIVATFYSGDTGTRVAVVAPVVALAVPLFDMLSVVWLRFRRGESIMKGDKRHFSHRLVENGMTSNQAVAFIYLVAAVTGFAGALLVRVGAVGTTVIVLQTVAVFVIVGLLTAPRAESRD